MGNTPNVRFKGFTEDWEQRKFGDLGSVAMCKRVFKEQTTPVGEIPFYKIGTFGAEPDAFISRELFEEYKSKFQYPNVGDMLISASGTIGRTVEYSGEEAYFQDSNIVWFKHDDRIDNSFLRCIYNIVKWNGIEGSTIKRLYNDNFLKTEFYMPTTGEQAKIGAYFRSLDHLITLHQQKCDETKEFKKYMLQNMFPQKDEKVPKIRFDGFTGDWKQRKLGDVLDDMYNGQTPSRNKSEYWNGNIKWLSSGELNRGTVYNSIETITEDGQKSANLRIVPKGTFIMAITGLEAAGTRGNCALLGVDTTLNQSCMALFPKKDLLTSDFLFQWYRKIGEEYGINYTQGTKQQSYNAELIKILPISLPSVAEQKKIASHLRSLDHLITLHQQRCNALKEFKKYMLQNMFPQKGENKCQN